MKYQNICIIIPVYNEKNKIQEIIRQIKEIGIDLLVIDDGSVDETRDIIREEKIKVIYHKENKGKGYSLKEGFQYAIDKGYEGIITMDGDGQHLVEDIKQFIIEIQKDSQILVIGNRMKSNKNMPIIRQWTNKIMSSIISRICKQEILDTQCGYRYIATSILKKVELKTNEFELETEILIQASRLKYKIISVPIQTIYGDEKSKINPIRHTIKFINYIRKEIF